MKSLLTAAALLLATVEGPALAGDQNSSQPVALATFSFEHGSSKLRPDAATLDTITRWFLANPDGVIVLGGHADAGAPADAALRLGFARAKAVRAELVASGVDPDHIVVAAYGEGGTPSVRARRVVVWGASGERVTQRSTSWPIRRASSRRSSGAIHGIATRARSVPCGSANRM